MLDVTRHKHRGNRNSEAAFEEGKQRFAKHYPDVVSFLFTFESGTSKAIAAYYGIPLNALSGRLTELKAKGIIYDTGVREDGCGVLKLTDNAYNRMRSIKFLEGLDAAVEDVLKGIK
jgi:hypothetical protein